MKLPQFSLRDLFWLTTVVALAVGWCVDHRRQKPELDRAHASQKKAEESVEILTKLIEVYRPFLSVNEPPHLVVP